MRDTFLSLGEHDAAKQAFRGAVAIWEQLIAREPARAEHQVGLAISLAGGAGAAPEGPIAAIRRALSIMSALDEQGRLTPEQQKTMAAMENLLQQLQETSGDS